MSELPTRDVLCLILEMMKEQAIYLDRQHRWLVAVADTVNRQPDLSAYLKAHPFYDLGPRPDLDRTNEMLQRIDALIRKLMEQ
jgi:hypothetical protein